MINQPNSPLKVICDPTYDITFKRLFAEDTPDGRQRTIHLLNSILHLDIFDLEFKPTIEESDIFNKKIIFDILCHCHCKKGSIIYSVDIEIQKTKQSAYFDRTVFYCARSLINTSQPKQAFDDILKSIVLSFLDCVLDGHDKDAAFTGRIIKTPIEVDKDTILQPVVVLSDKIE